MKVYAVIKSDEHSDKVVKIFTTKERAVEYAKHHFGDNDFFYVDGYEVEE